jgi:Leu/Phe-tRNA-protein transferase
MRWCNLKNKFRVAIQEYIDNYAEKINRQVKERKETWINYSRDLSYKMIDLIDLNTK